jgi:UDP-glucose 4-epimerase
VVDLAEGHVAALNHIFGSREPYCDPINLGTGTGTSVLDMIKVRAHDQCREPPLSGSLACRAAAHSAAQN